MESERGSIFCFDAFSSREPVSTSLENALISSGVAVGKAAGQCQPHLRAAGAGAQPQLRAAARGAALHIAQTARGLVAGDAPTVGHQFKTLAVILDGDAALRAVGIDDCLDAHRDTRGAGML